MNVGLTQLEAERRLAAEGPNALPVKPAVPAWRILLRQFQGPMVWALGAAALLSLFLGSSSDAVAILALLALNGGVGFIQEARTEKSLDALQALSAPTARVWREDAARVVPATQVVRGDVLVLEAGDRISADGRVIEAYELSTNEAAMSGESLPVTKTAGEAEAGSSAVTGSAVAFQGTTVSSGAGRILVTHTGTHTELARTARLMGEAHAGKTPLQIRLEELTRKLLLLCLAVVAVVAVIGLARGLGWSTLVLSSLSLAVAAMPEGMPAIVTIALAVGAQRMAAKNALVRRLASVETLGCATVICTDKTGTLTRGTMSVRALWGPDEAGLLRAAAACCDAELSRDGEAGTGDTMELAILTAAAARGVHRRELEAAMPRVEEVPFDSRRKWMAVRRADGKTYVKGALEALLPRATSGASGAEEANTRLAEQGLRVLAVAVGNAGPLGPLELVGLVGLADPPRPEAKAAIAAARQAGIRTVMITGDHPTTALAIAREIGLLQPGESAEECVRARATAAEKLALVRSLKAAGEVVAMTGDGVNDGPALREAHVGIAMGLGGTDVAREAADLVLTDDNFATLVEAVRQGRGIYDNIRKAVVYLLSGNAAELLVMLIASAVGWPLPLLPAQLLWVNLVTDGLPALALVMDPVSADVLERPPRPPSEPLLGLPQWTRVLGIGVLDTAVVLGAFAWGRARGGVAEGRDLAFTTLVLTELLRSFAARSDRRTFFQLGVASNRLLVGVVLGTVALQLLLHAVGPLRALLGVQRLSVSTLGIALALGAIPVTVIELLKLLPRRTAKR